MFSELKVENLDLEFFFCFGQLSASRHAFFHLEAVLVLLPWFGSVVVVARSEWKGVRVQNFLSFFFSVLFIILGIRWFIYVAVVLSQCVKFVGSPWLEPPFGRFALCLSCVFIVGVRCYLIHVMDSSVRLWAWAVFSFGVLNLFYWFVCFGFVSLFKINKKYGLTSRSNGRNCVLSI